MTTSNIMVCSHPSNSESEGLADPEQLRWLEITSVIYLAVWAWQLSQFVTGVQIIENDPNFTLSDSVIYGIYAAYSINIIVVVFLLISSILLLVGISKDIRGMLIPYMVAMVALISLQIISWIIIFALLGLAGVIFIVNLVFWLLFTALNITCLLCVISQFQEYRDGRGKANNTV